LAGRQHHPGRLRHPKGYGALAASRQRAHHADRHRACRFRAEARREGLLLLLPRRACPAVCCLLLLRGPGGRPGRRCQSRGHRDRARPRGAQLHDRRASLRPRAHRAHASSPSRAASAPPTQTTPHARAQTSSSDARARRAGRFESRVRALGTLARAPIPHAARITWRRSRCRSCNSAWRRAASEAAPPACSAGTSENDDILLPCLCWFPAFQGELVGSDGGMRHESRGSWPLGLDVSCGAATGRTPGGDQQG
jgi:hypothetical protein